MRGRMPVPYEMYDVRGNPGGRPRPAAPAPLTTPTSKNTAPPRTLSKSARRVWRSTVAPAILDGRIDATLDAALASVFCNLAAEIDELDRLIRTDPDAQIAISGAAVRARRARAAAISGMSKAADALGFSPASRRRLGYLTAPKVEGETVEQVRARLRR